MTYLIDSDWVIDVFNGQQSAINTLITLAPQGLFLSVATYGELYEGAYYSRDPQTALRQLQTFLTGKALLSSHPADHRNASVVSVARCPGTFVSRSGTWASPRPRCITT